MECGSTHSEQDDPPFTHDLFCNGALPNTHWIPRARHSAGKHTPLRQLGASFSAKFFDLLNKAFVVLLEVERRSLHTNGF